MPIYANVSLQESVLISISAVRNTKLLTNAFVAQYSGRDVSVDVVKRFPSDLMSQNERLKTEWNRHTSLTAYLDYWISQCQLEDTLGGTTQENRQLIRDGRQAFQTNINAALGELKTVIRKNRRSGEFDVNDEEIPVTIPSAELSSLFTLLNTLAADIVD